MATQRGALAFVVLIGLLPYLVGGSIVFFTYAFLRLALVGILITLVCTTGAYVMRKRRSGGEYAIQRLIVDPFLYGVEFAMTAVLVHYVISGSR
jgi:hypothetical protein